MAMGMSSSSEATSNAIAVADAYVVSNYSLDFATDDWVKILDTNDLSFTDGTDDSAFSISAWIKIPDIVGYDLIFSKYKDTSPFVGEYDMILSSGKLVLQTLDGASNIKCKSFRKCFSINNCSIRCRYISSCSCIRWE